MTKIREPLSVEHVLSNVINKLDENDIKNITNKSSSHFRKCSDPDDKDHTLYLPASSLLSRAGFSGSLTKLLTGFSGIQQSHSSMLV